MTTIATAAKPADLPAGWLPRAGSVLVVLARPGQESAELGGLLYAFRRAGADLALLCLTRGEASAVNFTGSARLEAVRPWELQLAASVLGIPHVTVASYPDGDLGRQPEAELRDRIGRAIREHAADLLLVIDPAAGDADDDGSAMDDAAIEMDDVAVDDAAMDDAAMDMDDAAVAAAACTAARRAGVPVLARTGPPGRVPGAWVIDLGPDAGTARIIQKAAVAAHESQSPALPELIRRLDRLDGREHLRWLVTPAWARRTPERQEKTCPTTRPRPIARTARKPPTPLTSLPWHRADTSW
ncbi:MAG TPA: PIG-L family deacetylase [Streptosporangiaceae bacterium]|jgi:LmbE family N-acetylglucosaminyl deacetylase